jgi:hypothetical protein
MSRELQDDMGQGSHGEAPCPNSPTNLLAENGCNTPSDKGLNYLDWEEQWAIGCNSLTGEAPSSSSTRNMTQEEGIAYIKQVVEQIQVRQQAEKQRKSMKDEEQVQLSILLSIDKALD